MTVAHTWDLDVLHPGDFDADVIGTAVTGGRSSTGGLVHSSAYAFGGLVQVTYGQVVVDTRAQHLYWNMLARRLNGAVREVQVPILTDRIAPAGIAATLDGAHAAEATTVAIAVSAGAALTGGEWFGIDHANAGPRVYGIATVVSSTDVGGGAVDYVVTVAPPLREAAPDGAALTFSRPVCTMTLAPGQSMAWRVGSAWHSRPSVTFIEAEF